MGYARAAVTLLPPLLVFLSLAAGVAVAERLAQGRGRSAELRALDASLLGFAILVTPAYLLGFAGLFRPWVVGLASFGSAGAALALGGVGRWRATGQAIGRFFSAPFTLLRSLWQGREHVAALGLLLVIGVWAWTLLLTYLAPSHTWDGIWYHDSIVGLTLQNEGFSWADLPREHQVVNGYPRLIETLGALFVVLSDATWIEAPASLGWPLVAVAFTALVRSFTPWRAGAVALACVLLTTPALMLELHSTYIDIPVTFLVVAALAYLCRGRPERLDLWLAGLALGLFAGAKGTALLLAPVIGVFGVCRAIGVGRREGVLSALVPIGGALLFALLYAGPLYLRNYLQSGSPIWPVAFSSETLGVTFDGPVDTVVRWPPMESWLKETFGPPVQGSYHADSRPHGYGHALPFILPPLFVAALLRIRRAPGPARWMLAIGLAMAAVIPNLLWWGRFAILAVAPLLAFAAHRLLAKGRRALAQGLLGTMLFVHALTLWWAEPSWGVPAGEVVERLRMPARERAAHVSGNLMGEPEVFRARDAELDSGDVILLGGMVGFPALAWNRRMSNEVRFAEPGRLLPQADALNAEWLMMPTAMERRVQQSDDWNRVGMITDVIVVYRRVNRP